MRALTSLSHATIVAMLALFVAGPAAAAPVLHVTAGGVARVDDPYLPPRAASDLPPPPRRDAGQPARARTAGTSVRGALRRALLEGRIDQETHDRYRKLYDDARSARGRLSGARRAQLSAVIGTLERIAANGQLSAGRMPAMFLELQRNTAYWLAKPFPSGGARLTFGSSPIVFQYYPGQGLRFQPLANFSKANALYNACAGINTRPGTPCRTYRLRQLLDALAQIAARRGDFTAWEYYFPFGGGSPPWTSGMSQGTALQALSRSSKLLGRPDYLELARGALGAFQHAPPTGVRVAADGGSHYLLYSFARHYFVFNGFVQSLNGLRDYAEVSGDPAGTALFEAGERAARAEVPRSDTGAWSLYSQGGPESDLNYHRALRDFLRGLCDRTGAALYCDTAVRFTRYLEEDPRIAFLSAGGRGHGGSVRFRLSKLSRVSLRLTRHGQTAYFAKRSFGYGARTFGFTVRSSGRYAVRLEAVDLRNHHHVTRGSVTVRR